MIASKIITKRILGLLFGLAILFPSAIQLEHIFENHEHVVCKEVKTHIHESVTDCSLCDFQLTSFQFTFLQNNEQLGVRSFIPLIIYYDEVTSTHRFYSYLLRGPPQVQQYS